VRGAYERDPENFNLATRSKEQHAIERSAFQIIIIGKDGFMKATTEAAQFAPLDLSDRSR
jgi:hypothetical protein